MFTQKNIGVSKIDLYPKKKISRIQIGCVHIAALCAVPELNSELPYTKRFAFYQAGKCLIQTLLFDHPKISLLKLTESKSNVVSSIQNLPLIETRTNLETLLIGSYAGKVGELFVDHKNLTFYQPLSLFWNKGRVRSPRKRKSLVRVTGLFAKKSTLLQADNGVQTETKLSEIGYTGAVLRAAVLAEQDPRIQTSRFVFTDLNPVKQKVKVSGKLTFNDKNLDQVQNKSFSLKQANPKNDAFDGCAQIQNLLPLRHSNTLSRVQDTTVLMSWGAVALANQLNRFRIEQFLSQSDAGLLERTKATFLVQSRTVNGSIYSATIFNLQKNSIIGNLNRTEIKDRRVFNLFQSLEEQIKNVYFEKDVSSQSLGSQNSFLTNYYKKEFVTKQKSVTESFGSQTFSSMNQAVKEGSSAKPGSLQVNGTRRNTLLFSRKTGSISQKNEITVLCEEIVCKSLTSSIKAYGHWSRIYLPQIETHHRQSVFADQFFKKRRELGFVGYTKANPWHTDLSLDLRNLVAPNRLSVSIALPSFSYTPSKLSFLRVSQGLGSKVQLDLPSMFNPLLQRSAHVWPQELGYGVCHNLTLNTFSRAFTLIGKNRELLDVLADHFIRFEKIRLPEILRIFSFYVDISDLSATTVGHNSGIPATGK